MKRITFSLLLGMLCLFSSQLNAQDVTQDINHQLAQLVENNKLTAQDLQWEITSEHVSRTSGIHHVYFNQVINGLRIYGTESGIHIAPNGRVISSDIRFVQNSQNRISGSGTASLGAIQAVQAVANQLNYNITESLSVVNVERGPSQKTILSRGGISLSDIPAELMYQLNDNNELALAWNLSIEETTRLNWWSVRVDATTGIIINKNNWMVSCSFEHDHSEDEAPDYNKNLYDIPNYNEFVENNDAGCGECYEVFALPLESPLLGGRTIETNPADPTASPFGWHDTNGSAGAESNLTTGNNVDAFEAGDNSGYRPDGGAALDFTGFSFNMLWTNGDQSEDAAITNLFYWNNVIHDVLYQYGFDEAGGNFQENNYGNGGAGSDSVNANAQISEFCNATFGTPGDGGNPTMNMFICNGRDGNFDNLVVTHEYGHGISNRLTGGPGASGCLGNQEQMGEGWSDFYGAILSIQPGDVGTDARGVGTYLFGQGANGPGIRPFPYSTDLAVNPQTYDDIQTSSIPHGVGSVWCSMLWEVTWGLIDEYGFDEDIYNFTGDVTQDAGNVMAMALITEGMKLQPCSPGFVDGRDAIMAADQALYGGANICLLWDAFAKRGLGVSADQGSSGSVGDGSEAFDTPTGIAEYTAPTDVCDGAEVLTGLGGGTPLGGVYSGTGVIDNGNGATYSFDPVAAGVGVHTITYDTPGTDCAPPSSASDDIEVLSIPAGPTATDVSDYCPGDDVTVSATPLDGANTIWWFDAPTGGNFLFEGNDYTFTPSGSTSVFAQETPPVPQSQLVISEITLETPDRLEIQNVGLAFDYTGYAVAVSEQPYTDINTMNSVTQFLGPIGADGVVIYDDNTGSGDYWGDNIWWNNDGTGWIIIVDPSGDVVDSVFWNFTAAEIANLNVTINGFAITAADLDWTGDGASLTAECNDSFRRTGETDSSADWSGTCEPDDYGVANEDIGLGITGCLGERTEVEVTIDAVDPTLSCPADVIEAVNPGDDFTIPDYTGDATAADNCTTTPTILQVPAVGATVGAGVTVITLTAEDEAGNQASCTFNLTVEEVLSVQDAALLAGVVLYPNPTRGDLSLVNNSGIDLVRATVTDVNGRTIQTIDLRAMTDTADFSISALANGLYFVKIDAAETSIVKRIVKQ